jgi:hypothetical protein
MKAAWLVIFQRARPEAIGADFGGGITIATLVALNMGIIKKACKVLAEPFTSSLHYDSVVTT